MLLYLQSLNEHLIIHITTIVVRHMQLLVLLRSFEAVAVQLLVQHQSDLVVPRQNGILEH